MWYYSSFISYSTFRKFCCRLFQKKKKKLNASCPLVNLIKPWSFTTSAKTWRSTPFGLLHMSMHLMTFVSFLTLAKGVLPNGDTMIAFMNSSYPHPIQCNLTLVFSTLTWHITCICYWRKHQKCTLVKSKIGWHLHIRSISPGPHSMRTSTMLNYNTSFNDHYIASQIVFIDETSKDDHMIY